MIRDKNIRSEKIASHKRIIEQLIASGINVTIKNNNQTTAKKLAYEVKSDYKNDVIRMLQDAENT